MAQAHPQDHHKHSHHHTHTPTKLDNPVRIAELQPEETLRRFGFESGQVLCDIGAGSGIFTLPAARLTQRKVLALDINPEMLAHVSEKAQQEALHNIELVQVHGDHLDVVDQSVDLALLVTVLHEIEGKSRFLAEINRLLKTDGRLGVIEFHHRETPFGPPVGDRLDRAVVIEMLAEAGFQACDDFDLGPNFYGLLFKR